MKKYAVIVAGGSGTRMQSAVPKQFLLLHNRPVLFYTIQRFVEAFADINIILVLPEVHKNSGETIVKQYFPHIEIQIALGGETRFHSVQNGLALVKEQSIVFVHDAVRCLLSAALIHRCYEKAVSTGSAIPVIASSDSVRIKTEHSSKLVDRSTIMLVQTPQVFESSLLLSAFEKPYQSAFTDEASVVESCGHSITLVEGETQNIKITHPIDLLIAEKYLSV
jgi:2-C-methyl-D-erythritol 4-phosphate cytidylyltransferase